MKGTKQTRHLKDASALHLRAVDEVIAQLIREIGIDFPPTGLTFVQHLSALRTILATDYLRSSALAEIKQLLPQLARIVDQKIRLRFGRISSNWRNAELLQLAAEFGPREIEIRAQPYRNGIGLGLRGFSCRTEPSTRGKFLIFLNTAHLPVAVAATFGHELGHFIYASTTGETEHMSALLEGSFTDHLSSPSELFADSLVALAAYDRQVIEALSPAGETTVAGVLARIMAAHHLIGARYGVDLMRAGRISALKRVRYLSSMIHFLKLRRALLESAGL